MRRSFIMCFKGLHIWRTDQTNGSALRGTEVLYVDFLWQVLAASTYSLPLVTFRSLIKLMLGEGGGRIAGCWLLLLCVLEYALPTNRTKAVSNVGRLF